MTDKADRDTGDVTKAVAEQVAGILRDRIVKGDLAPRDRLVERRLSAELSVSRTPVREALKLLEADGLIEISLHRGAQVVPYLPDDALRLFDVISVLEGLAARRLVALLTPAIMLRLEELHAQMIGYYHNGRSQQYFDINTVIHDLIVETCGNPVLAETHKRLIARARRGRFLAIMDPDRMAQAVSEHETVMRAFRDRDADAAARIWEQHLRHTGTTVTEVLRAQEAAAAI